MSTSLHWRNQDTNHFMLMGIHTPVRELNRAMEDDGGGLEVEETHFRPNIYIDGDIPAFAEDEWTFN